MALAVSFTALLMVGLACGSESEIVQAEPEGPCGAGYQECDNGFICVPDDRTCDEADLSDVLSGVWVSTAPGSEPADFISLFYVNRDGLGGWHRSTDGGLTWEKLLIQWELTEAEGTVDDITLIQITVLEGDPQLISVQFVLHRKDGEPGFACDDLPSDLRSEMPCYLWCAPGIDCDVDPTAPATLFVKCSAHATEADACGISSGITPLID
ncbi:MAG: hypothetical protein JRI68_03880 [Deltaproteobacteria bacterium]|nr:hypothetical protein [Deltaproteobacteria bacterium]